MSFTESFKTYRTMRVWLGLLVTFLFALIQSCSELNHSLRGITATATIKLIEDSSYDHRNVRVTMQFDDRTGRTHVVKRTVPRKRVDYASNDPAGIIYIPGGEDRARLLSERSFFWPIVLVAMIGAIIAWSVVTYRRMEAGKF